MNGDDNNDNHDRPCLGHDDYDIGSQNHDDALRKFHRKKYVNIKVGCLWTMNMMILTWSL